MKQSEFLRTLISIKALLESGSPDEAVRLIDEILDEEKEKITKAEHDTAETDNYEWRQTFYEIFHI